MPIVVVGNHTEAINFINQREKPLALYVFSNDTNIVEEFKEQTSSGSLGVNEVLMQISCIFFYFYINNKLIFKNIYFIQVECVPFGGVGDSGIGRYHGSFSIETFSHQRTILKSSFVGDGLT